MQIKTQFDSPVNSDQKTSCQFLENVRFPAMKNRALTPYFS